MHKNELFFDLVFLVTPLDPPKFTPSLYPPLEVGPLAIPAEYRYLILIATESVNVVSNLRIRFKVIRITNSETLTQ